MPLIHRLDEALATTVDATAYIQSWADAAVALVQNSLDSGCARVELQLGPRSLSVADDGSGIGLADLDLVGRPNHTSKLDSFGDNQKTYGFRGLSLFHLAQLAFVKICSRGYTLRLLRADRVLFEGNDVTKFATEVTVSDLFMNIPLRSTTTSLRQICDALVPLMLTHPDCTFTIGSDRTTLRYTKGTLDSRISDVLGSGASLDLYHCSNLSVAYISKAVSKYKFINNGSAYSTKDLPKHLSLVLPPTTLVIVWCLQSIHSIDPESLRAVSEIVRSRSRNKPRPSSPRKHMSTHQSPLFPRKLTCPLHQTTLSKQDLATCRVVAQVDSKFILVRIGKALALIDQHAADERIRLESYLQSYLDDASPVALKEPVSVPMTLTEDQCMVLSAWGFQISPGSICLVTAVPSLLVKCTPDLLMDSFTSLLTSRPPRSQSYVSLVGSIPAPVYSVIADQACHSAIKFGQHLSHEECLQLVSSLAHCHFPFKCAHGRPSVVPLVEV